MFATTHSTRVVLTLGVSCHGELDLDRSLTLRDSKSAFTTETWAPRVWHLRMAIKLQVEQQWLFRGEYCGTLPQSFPETSAMRIGIDQGRVILWVIVGLQWPSLICQIGAPGFHQRGTNAALRGSRAKSGKCWWIIVTISLRIIHIHSPILIHISHHCSMLASIHKDSQLFIIDSYWPWFARHQPLAIINYYQHWLPLWPLLSNWLSIIHHKIYGWPFGTYHH